MLQTLGGRVTSRTVADVDYSLNGGYKNYYGILATITEAEHAKYLEGWKLLCLELCVHAYLLLRKRYTSTV